MRWISLLQVKEKQILPIIVSHNILYVTPFHHFVLSTKINAQFKTNYIKERFFWRNIFCYSVYWTQKLSSMKQTSTCCVFNVKSKGFFWAKFQSFKPNLEASEMQIVPLMYSTCKFKLLGHVQTERHMYVNVMLHCNSQTLPNENTYNFRSIRKFSIYINHWSHWQIDFRSN